jgi:hypothetical protein
MCLRGGRDLAVLTPLLPIISLTRLWQYAVPEFPNHLAGRRRRASFRTKLGDAVNSATLPTTMLIAT